MKHSIRSSELLERYDTVVIGAGQAGLNTSRALQMADIETVSGDVELSGALGRGARIDIESVTGKRSVEKPTSG